MILGLLTRIAGPKVLLGVLVAAGLALGFTTWRWLANAEEATTARQTAQQYRQTANDNAEQVQRLQAQQRRNEQLVTEAQAASEQAQQRAQRLRAQLGEAQRAAPENVQKCGNTALPDDLADGLRVDNAATADESAD